MQFVDRDTAIAAADYLSLHTRAEATTGRMIDRDVLRAMKTTAVLINTARGSLVDEDALADALDSGRSPAPHSTSSTLNRSRPQPSARTGQRIITSHLAGQTVEARARAGLAAAHAVIDVLDGREPSHPVDRI